MVSLISTGDCGQVKAGAVGGARPTVGEGAPPMTVAVNHVMNVRMEATFVQQTPFVMTWTVVTHVSVRMVFKTTPTAETSRVLTSTNA